MSKIFTEKEIKTIKSMGRYWEEVIRRDEPITGILTHELNQLWGLVGVRKILFAVLEQARKEQNNERAR
ncbi:MAG: hypothetical protein ACTSPV_00500 [Candidatus Hodarchaeales archaeon]